MSNEKRRLIDANALKRAARKWEREKFGILRATTVLVGISNAPTVDAVEVVRCCSCEQHDHDGADGYCNRWGKWTKMSDFCSYGEKGKDDV